jgi:hypothetical protein
MKRVLFLQGAVLLGVAVATASCTQGLPSQGTYDAVLPNNTVITLRLERMDNGKVEGSIQAVAVNTITNTVVNLPVAELQGEIFKDNLSLNSTNTPKAVSYLGQVKDNTITLQYGNETTVFQQVDAAQHATHLATLEKQASGLRDFRSRQAVLGKLHTSLLAEQKELQDYVAWEPKFNQDVVGLQNWYDTQLAAYQKCLISIRSAAAANVPKWRWQECAIQANVAAYSRQQTLRNLSAVADKQNTTAGAITAALRLENPTLVEVRRQTEGLLADCKYAVDASNCESFFEHADEAAKVQKTLFDPQDVASFQSFQPTAQKNLATLESIRNNEAAHLETLATEIGAVYSKAN